MNNMLETLFIGFGAGVFAFGIASLMRSHKRLAMSTGALVVAAALVYLVASVTVAQVVVGTLTAIAAAAGGLNLAKRSLAKSVKMAPSVRDYALAHFKELDIDGNGVITASDLELAVRDEALSAADRKLVNRLRWDLRYAGHLVDSYISVSPMNGAAATIEVYGASREDLASYTVRITAEYEREYGRS